MEKSRTEEESGPDGAEVDAPSSSSFCVVGLIRAPTNHSQKDPARNLPNFQDRTPFHPNFVFLALYLSTNRSALNSE